MLVNKTYTIEIFPDNEMTQLFWQHIGAARFCYNYVLNLSQESHKTAGKRLNRKEMRTVLLNLKRVEEFKWLKNICSTTLQNAVQNLDNAYERFFSGQNRLPRFKSKKKSKPSFLLVCNQKNKPGKQTIRFEAINGKLKLRLNKLGYVDFTQHRKPPKHAVINTATIVFENNRWFAKLSCTTEIDRVKTKEISGFKHTAIDPGVKTLMTFSDGWTIAKFDLLNPHEERMLRIWLRRASRRYVRGAKEQSKGYHEARNEANKLIRKAIDRRNDYYHKLTRQMVEEYDLISVEATSFNQLMKAFHGTAKVWQKYAPATFLEMLKYKCEWYGVAYIEAPRFFPSTQMCSNCGQLTGPKGLEELHIREWKCSNCGANHLRDENAAKNIDLYGLETYLHSLQ